MTYENEKAGRVDEGLSNAGRADFWTFDAVEERLIEAMRLWWRSPGGGRWPFAGDGPWNLMTRETRAQAGAMAMMELWKIEQEERRLGGGERPPPLTRADMARRDEASEWLAFVPSADRELVVHALVQLAAGAKAVPWTKLKHRLGIRFGVHGLRKRYSRAITKVAQALNDGRSAVAAVG